MIKLTRVNVEKYVIGDPPRPDRPEPMEMEYGIGGLFRKKKKKKQRRIEPTPPPTKKVLVEKEMYLRPQDIRRFEACEDHKHNKELGEKVVKSIIIIEDEFHFQHIPVKETPNEIAKRINAAKDIT